MYYIYKVMNNKHELVTKAPTRERLVCAVLVNNYDLATELLLLPLPEEGCGKDIVVNDINYFIFHSEDR